MCFLALFIPFLFGQLSQGSILGTGGHQVNNRKTNLRVADVMQPMATKENK